MGHTYYAVYEHIAFSTKHRQKLIDEQIQMQLFPYLAQAVKNQGCKCLIAGGHEDHVHLLVQKSSTLLTPDLIKEIKRTSSKWMKGKKRSFEDFNWQTGYGAFSVSYSNIKKVMQYIESQKEHHKKFSWEKEFRALLVKHGIRFDERFYLD